MAVSVEFPTGMTTDSLKAICSHRGRQMSWKLTILSNILDKMECSRLRGSGMLPSHPVWLSWGVEWWSHASMVMEVGVVSDTYNKLVTYGTKVSITSFSNHVSSGSEAHLLDGDDLTAFTTSFTVTALRLTIQENVLLWTSDDWLMT